MRRVIHLHGKLGRRFGRRHEFDVRSPAEAVRALCSQLPGFEAHVRQGSYVVSVDRDRPVDESTLHFGMGSRRHLHIAPAAQAGGFLAVALIGLTLITAAVSIVTILSMPKPPRASEREEATRVESYIYDGPVNRTEQGHAIPVVYGEVRVGSLVIGSAIETSDVNQAGVSGDVGHVGTLPGISGSPGGDEWSVSKGGKGGAGTTRAAQEDPNSLQSQATAKVLDLLCEGEIVGLVDGLKSIYFDETPLQNPDGSFNFSGVVAEQRVGLPDQDPIPGFERAANTTLVNQKASISLGPVTRTVANPDADVARVTVRLPRLYQQDTTNGDLKRTRVTVAIDYQANGGGFSQVIQHAFDGKQNGPYQRSFDIRLAATGPHDIRLRRVSPDSTVASLENETFFDLLTEVTEAKLSYPNSALVGLTVDARQFGSSIPTRSYLIRGRIIRVPTNYDPVARSYTGIWDGTFKLAYSNNPAWCIFDLATHKRYGLGRRIPAWANDKWSLYEIAQYCDEPVPDGAGGLEPRYQMNAVLHTAAQAYELIASMASNFRGFAYWGSGALRFTQDRPEDPSIVVTAANTIDGRINYSRITPKAARRSVVVMHYNDPLDGYRLVPEVVENPELIRRFGWSPGADLTAIGVTSRGHARRLAGFVLEDEQGGNTQALYQTGNDHSLVDPGRVAIMADKRYTTGRMGGRLAGVGANAVTLDAPVTLAAGRTYWLTAALPTGVTQRRQVTNAAGAHTVLNLAAPGWSAQPIQHAVWALESDQIAHRQFRIRSITRTTSPYEVRAVLHDPTKYPRVEQGVDLSTPSYMDLISGGLEPPGAITYQEYLAPEGTAVVPAAQISWLPGPDPRVLYYQAQYKRPGERWEELADGAQLSREVRGIYAGSWGFRVRGLDGIGRKTAWRELTVTLAGQEGSIPPATGLGLVSDDDALTAVVRWTAPADPRPLRYRIYFGATNVLASAQEIGVTDSLEWPVTQAGWYFVRTDFMGGLGAAASLQVTTAQLPEPRWTRTQGRPLNLSQLDSAAAGQLAGALADITSLETIYGDTVSAAASAAAAANSANAAQTAQTNSEAARTQSQTARDAAQAAQAAALASQTAAGLSQTASAASAVAASSSAGQASGSAASAATNAASSLTNATNAATSASAAQIAAVTAAASSSAYLNLNPHFEQDAARWTTGHFTPVESGLVGSVLATYQGRSKVFSGTGQSPIYSDFIPARPDRRYRMGIGLYSPGTSSRFYAGVIPYDGSKTSLTGGSSLYFIALNSQYATGWHDLEGDVWAGAPAGPSQLPAGTAYLRTVVLLNHATPGQGQWGLDYCTLLDVTESEDALASANAAATSESSAAASSTSAGQQASAAQTSATNAATSAGQASTFRDQASTSATTAAGHAATASTQAGLAAGSATAAGGSATAASTQAGIATTQAGAAANSATAAQASSLSAQSFGAGTGITPNGQFAAGLTHWTNFAGGAATGVSHVALQNGRSDVAKAATGQSGQLYGKAVPIDPSRRYRIRVGVRVQSGSARFYAGFAPLDAAGAALSYSPPATVFNSSALDYALITAAEGWRDFVSPVVTGTGTAQTTFPAGAAQVRAYIQMNADSAATETYCSNLFIEDVTESEVAASSATAAVTAAGTATTKASEAGASASAASASATTAGTHAANASTSAGQASTASSTAGGHASSAQTSATNAANSATAAGASASAASGHASTASTQASAAGVSATAAQQASTSAQGHSASALTSSQTATAQASTATGQAAAAASSAYLAAQVGIGALNPNPVFANYTAGPNLPPDQWTSWGNSQGFSKVAGLNGGNALRMAIPGGLGEQGIYTFNPGAYKPGDWLVVEADISLVFGTLKGALVALRFYDGAAGYLGGTDLNLPNLPDATGSIPFQSGNQNGQVGSVYRWRLLVQAPTVAGSGPTYQLAIYGIASGYYSPDYVKTIDWHRLSVRAATPAEIRDQTVLAPMQATVSQSSTAIATLQGQQATLDSRVTAGESSIVSNSTAISGLQGTTASHGTRLTAAESAVSTNASAVAGLGAEYGVKVESGKVVGFKALASPTVSDFIVQADRFAVETGGDRPFEVVGGVTYIKNAVIQNQAVTTPRLAANATYEFAYQFGSRGGDRSTPANGVWYNLPSGPGFSGPLIGISFSVPAGAGSVVSVDWIVGLQGDGSARDNASFRLIRVNDGAVIQEYTGGQVFQSVILQYPFSFVDPAPIQGAVNEYRIQWRPDGDGYSFFWTTMIKGHLLKR